MLFHPFAPSTINKDSKVLILGSFPSVASREMGFYYAHSQNRLEAKQTLQKVALVIFQNLTKSE